MTPSSLPPNPTKGRVPWFLLGVVLLAAGLVLGALRLEILVDDAFIAFRYVGNARDGHGLVWNAPPFQPVEGYTSFLWVLVLWAVWAWFGIEPPHACNVLSIGCGLLSLLVCAVAVARVRDREGRSLPVLVLLLALGCITGNRTFLQWQTSGLETALFDLVVVVWAVLAFRAPASRGVGWWAAWSLAAAATALTRPDGLLFVAATAAAGCTAMVRDRAAFRRVLVGLAPLLFVVAHVAWRRSFYGEWLPNTYYAKVGASWFEAGWRYFACFALENAVWLWCPLALVWFVAELRRPSVLRGWWTDHVPALAVIGALVGHVAYYVLRVGGDHFEFRVFSHLIPLGVLAAVVMAARLWRSHLAIAAALLALGASSSVGWYQLAVTEFRIPPRYDRMAPHVPSWVRPVARWYDRQRLWMQMHMVGIRFLHGLTFEAAAQLFPERQRRATGDDDVPVLRATAVGWVGWVLPDVAVIDELGLNDWVAARSPAHLIGDILFPKAGRDLMQQRADADHDGFVTRDELATAYASSLGRPADDAATFASTMLELFAGGDGERLAIADLAEIERFCAELKLMAHERLAPADYMAALDPNVTIVGREVVIRQRQTPLRAADVQALEASWRERLRSGGTGK